MINIRGGKFLHRKLEQPSLEITRSTKDICKEGMFNSLGREIINSSFLDLFAGSGQIGIEAYSRGAKNVVLNDKNKEPYKIIRNNLDKLGIDDILVTNYDYLECLERLKNKEYKFDIIFLDPPYKMILDLEFINKINSYNLLNENGTIVLETDYELDKKLFECFNIRRLKYGRSSIYILRKMKWE